MQAASGGTCRLALIVLAALTVALTACAGPAPPSGTCAGRPAAASFDENVTTTHTDNLTIRYLDGAAVVTVPQPSPGGAPVTVVLTRCGRTAPHLPPDLAAAPRVSTPVRSLYSASSTHLPMLDETGRLDVLRGVASPAGIVSAPVRTALAEHRVASFAASGTTDVEAVLAARPDVFVTGGIEDPATARLALLRDAGGSYPWADRPETGRLRLSLEEVFARAGSAPVWLTTATDWTTRDDARRADPRHGLFAAMGPGGRDWTASRARTPDGANDWYERGVTGPDLVLGDMAAALHPDRFPDHRFTFFAELTGP